MVTTRRLAALAVSAAVLAPPRLLRATPTICLFRRLTGRPCPSCGLTRSWNAAARLDLRRAHRLHPLGPATLVGAGLFAAAPDLVLDQPWLRSPRVVGALVAGWLIVWLARVRRPADAFGRAA
jgi:hypothetical protein